MRILVGVTTAPEARAALERAVEEARLRQAELIVVDYLQVGLRSESQSERYQASERRLDQLRSRLQDEGISVRTRHGVGVSSASRELLKVAEDEDVDLIVIGMRRRSPVGKLVLGSNAQDVLLGADCPVLAVKPPPETES